METSVWRKLCSVLLFLLAQTPSFAQSKIIRYEAKDERRDIFSIEEFGLVQNGFLSVSVSKLQDEDTKNHFVGFVISRTQTIGKALEVIRKERIAYSNGQGGSCPYHPTNTPPGEDFFLINCTKDACAQAPVSFVHRIERKDQEGLYGVVFVSCSEDSNAPVSFVLETVMYNEGPVYLSAGEAPVPTILFIFALVFFLLLVIWIKLLRQHPSTIHHVHHMMSILLVLKSLSLLFQAIDLHYLKTTGYVIGWNVVYYIFVTLKGISFFTVLLMIGSGWSLLKPTLNDRELKILLIVLPLQLLADIALIIEEERTKGSQGWFRWRDLFLIIDFLCAIAVILPVIWQINFLKQAANVDGHAQVNLAKLKQFQKFYIQMLAYVYFTRVLLFLLGTTLPFYELYWKTILRELATAIFFILTGYRFRPAANNPYLRVKSEDDEIESRRFFDEIDNDFGLGDDVEGDQELVPPNKNIYSMQVI